MQLFLSLSKCSSTLRRILKTRDEYARELLLNQVLINPLVMRKGVYGVLRDRRQEISEVMVDSGAYLVQQGRLPYKHMVRMLPSLHRQIPDAEWYVLPDHIPLSGDDDAIVGKKVRQTIANAVRFVDSHGQDFGTKLIGVVHGRRKEHLARCIEAYAGLGITRVGFGSLVTNGPNNGINSFSKATIDALLEVLRLANSHGLELHIFGVSSPVQLLICGLLGAASADSSAWNRIAGYGLIYVPFLRSYYVTDRGRSSRVYSITQLRRVSRRYWPDALFLPGRLLKRCMYARSVHNWGVLRYMAANMRLPTRRQVSAIARWSPRNAVLLRYALARVGKAQIRKATVEDLDTILTLARSHTRELGYVGPGELKAAILRSEVIVAEHLNRVVAFQEYRHLRRRPQTTLYHKVVAPGFRRRGVGTRLTDYVVCEAKALGKTTMVVKCVEELEANAFHRSCGFALVRTESGRSRRVNVYSLRIN